MPTFALPTFLFGPNQGARNSTILERSGGSDDVPEAERRVLGDLPLALAGWMGAREEDEIYGCLPLSRATTGGRLLFRAAYLRDVGGEPYGLAVGVYLPRELLHELDGHAERLVDLLPWPDRDTRFVAAPLTLDTASLPALADGVPVGLEWDDRAVMVEDGTPPLAVARTLLAGLRRPPQHRRVRGWVTTSRFPSLGGIDARSSFQLVVSAGSPPREDYPTAIWRGEFRGPVSAPPPAWAAWQKLHALVADDRELAEASNWAANLAGLAPAAVAEGLLARALSWPNTGPRLFLAMAHRFGLGGALADPAARIEETVFTVDAEQRGALISALVRMPDPQRTTLGLWSLLARAPALAWETDPDTFALLLTELDWLGWMGRNGHTRFGTIEPEHRYRAIEHGLAVLLADPRPDNPVYAPLKGLVLSLIGDNNSLVQSNPRNVAIARQVSAASEAGLPLIDQRNWNFFENWARYLPKESLAPVRKQLYRVPPGLPADRDQLVLLTDLIAAVNRAGRPSQQGFGR
ncbi:MAG TPA: hypothetical protein VFV30_01905 [Novosphingobium sp.]|nr:hypothetical protein [Novosphingobium sp.]